MGQADPALFGVRLPLHLRNASPVFQSRVCWALGMLRRGVPKQEIRERHGSIVLEEALNWWCEIALDKRAKLGAELSVTLRRHTDGGSTASSLPSTPPPQPGKRI
jgi:hypothetical protein